MRTLLILGYTLLMILPVYSQSHQQSFSFSSGKIQLEGTLYLPDSSGTGYPVFIIVHKAGKQTRENYHHYVEQLTDQGYAVFVYDKRGSGKSKGKYRHVTLKNSTSVFEDLAKDVVAAGAFLQSRKEVDGRKIGLLGLSQGGWIVPAAANQMDYIFGAVVVSGSAVSVGTDIFYCRMTGNASSKKKAKLNFDELNRMTGLFEGKHGFDPFPYIDQLKIPVLWIFGEKDVTIPTKLCVEKLEALQDRQSHLQFDIRLFAEADHYLYNVLTNSPVDYFSAVKEWLFGLEQLAWRN